MKFIRCQRCCYYLLAVLLVAGGTNGCRKRKITEPAVVPKVAAELLENRIGQWTGPVYQIQAKSSIRWQTWSRETFDRAKAANRLVFVVVVMPELPDFHQILQDLERDPAIVKSINENYVPILLDGNASREIGLLVQRLCGEIRMPVHFPLFMWLSYDANPVAWAPMGERREGNLFRIFNQSDGMVSRMWRDDPIYVMKNSASDNQSRRQRMTTPAEENALSPHPVEDSLQSLRRLISLYDPFSHSFDGAEGLYPVGVMDTLTAAALTPGVPENLRERSLETLRKQLDDLLPSAMFDPLEGGVFTGRTGDAWALPNFTWNCRIQARVAANLFRGYQLTGMEAASEKARGLLAFAEKKFQQPDGLFADGDFVKSGQHEWLWTIEEIEKALPPEDAKWWVAATGMKTLGNLPSESDPQRELFRSNTIALHQPLEAIAAKFSVPVEEFTRRFEQSRAKLLEIRESRLKIAFRDMSPSAESNFRMVSAYAAAYTATGEESYREKAVKLLALAKAKFSDGTYLTNYGQGGLPSITAGRAFLYALAIQAAQDVADITSDSSPLAWVDELSTKARESFWINNVLQEASHNAQLIDLPITDNQRVFDDTSPGLFALAAARRLAGDSEAESALKQLAPGLTVSSQQFPILYSDAILAELVTRHGRSIVLGNDLPSELKTAVERLPLQWFPRRAAKDSDGIPNGSVRIISPDGSGKLVSTPSALRDELLLPK